MARESAFPPRIEGQLHTRSLDQEMERMARRQHGVIARRQLRALGMGEGAISLRLERGHLHELHRGTYVVGVRRISRRGRWMAAVLASGPTAVLSHRSAARFWRVLPPAVEWVDVTCSGRQVRRRGILAHRTTIRDDEWLVEDAIPVTSVFRTIFDLAAVADKRTLERALHEAEVRGLTDRVSLPMLLERYPGRRGARSVRALLESPEPELDSRGVHGTRKRFESDRHRDRILVAEGWRTMRITWQQLQDEPEEIEADLRLALS